MDENNKILLIGESGVGKTSILTRYIYARFDYGVSSTIGVDFLRKETDYDGKQVKLQIWDTAGQERFHSITRGYYRDADAFLVVFSMADLRSFNSLDDWINTIQTGCNGDPLIIFVGNKIDEECVIDKEIVREYCNQLDKHVFFCSAKTGENIEEIFEHLVRFLPDKQEKNKKTIKIEQIRGKEKKKKCC